MLIWASAPAGAVFGSGVRAESGSGYAEVGGGDKGGVTTGRVGSGEEGRVGVELGLGLGLGLGVLVGAGVFKRECVGVGGGTAMLVGPLGPASRPRTKTSKSPTINVTRLANIHLVATRRASSRII
jgi:hypothetical protein